MPKIQLAGYARIEMPGQAHRDHGNRKLLIEACVPAKSKVSFSHIVFVMEVGDNALMSNKSEFPEMARATYERELIQELQHQLQRHVPFVTHREGCSGKFVEFSRSLYVEFRQSAYETKHPEDRSCFMRSMHPIGIALALQYSEDYKILMGDFSACVPDFIQQMSYDFKRCIDSIVLGVDYDDTMREYVISSSPTSTLDSKPSFYKGVGLEGILGTNYIGENLLEPETIPVQPMLTSGALAASAAAVTDPTKVDLEKTNVIPVNWVRSGTMADSSLTVDKILSLRDALKVRGALEAGEYVNMAITPKMKYDLISDEKLQNNGFDFQMSKDGFMSELLGIRFLVTNKVPVVNVGASGAPKWVYACPAWKTEEVVMGFWDNLKFEVSKPSKTSGGIVIRAECALGCARRSKESVMMVLCDGGLSFS